MKAASISLLLGCALMAMPIGCANDSTEPDSVHASLRAARSAKLNLSHIACAEDGGVVAHFVLLFAGDQPPGTISGTYNDGDTFGPVAADKLSGNVWHYNVSLASGWIDITSATTTTSAGQTVSLHNPSEYAGYYECGGATCDVAVEDHVFCSKALGNPGDECGAFGLDVLGKDDELSGTVFESTMNAYVAIVKGGRGECDAGEVAYRVVVDVAVGDELWTPSDQDISHVTYCACPAN